MADTTKDRVFGEDVDIVASNAATGATALTTWKKFSIKFNGKKRECRAASSPVLQQKIFADSVSGSASGYIGSGESLPELPQIGDILQSFSAQTVTEGADLLPSVAAYGDIVVTNTNYDQDEDAGMWGFDFESTGFTSA
jgi:hypothetical protein